jgi:ATP-dependent DNA helicase RecG
MTAHLQSNIFPEYLIGLIHGKMKGSEKDRVMTDFSEKRIQILVAITVEKKKHQLFYPPDTKDWCVGCAHRRLLVLEQTSDDFRIAEEDLAIRGPGEFMGTR